MIDIEKLKPLIVEALMSLKPDKIILFGSFAYEVPNDEIDISLETLYIDSKKIN